MIDIRYMYHVHSYMYHILLAHLYIYIHIVPHLCLYVYLHMNIPYIYTDDQPATKLFEKMTGLIHHAFRRLTAGFLMPDHLICNGKIGLRS